MTETLKLKIEEEILKLPLNQQEVIRSSDWVKISAEIGTKHLLADDEINDLQTEVGLALVGLEEFDSLAQNIENNVVTSKDDSEKIAAEINQQLFSPMTEKLDELIKGKTKTYSQGWKQSINFIVSGGNYSVFTEEDIRDNKSIAYREII